VGGVSGGSCFLSLDSLLVLEEENLEEEEEEEELGESIIDPSLLCLFIILLLKRSELVMGDNFPLNRNDFPLLFLLLLKLVLLLESDMGDGFRIPKGRELGLEEMKGRLFIVRISLRSKHANFSFAKRGEAGGADLGLGWSVGSIIGNSETRDKISNYHKKERKE